MFNKAKDMKGVISSFTAQAKTILEEQKKVAAAKQVEIDAAEAAKEAALNEAAIADAFIANVEALAQPKAE